MATHTLYGKKWSHHLCAMHALFVADCMDIEVEEEKK
jgi:hypothetical protein